MRNTTVNAETAELAEPTFPPLCGLSELCVDLGELCVDR
jgi:hypothetical protein